MLSTNIDSFHEITQLYSRQLFFLVIHIYLKITELYYIVDFCVDVIKINKKQFQILIKYKA